MSDGLFDADEYTKPGMTPKKPRQPSAPKPVPPTVAVEVDDVWRYNVRSQPGVVHAGRGRPVQAAVTTYCGQTGVALTYEDGDVVHGCEVCIQRGARARLADAS